MRNKFLYILIALILCVSLANSFTYVHSFNLVESTFTGLYNAVDRISGLFGVLSDRTEKLTYLFPSSLGVLELENQNIDIANYINDHMFPSWIHNISNEYSVSLYASPVTYSVVAEISSLSSLLPNRKDYVCFQSSNCIRLKIVISGSNYYSEHNILACMGNFYFSRNETDYVYGLYYFSFDKGFEYFDVGVGYSTLEQFLSDGDDVSSILYSFPTDITNYPLNRLSYTEGSNRLDSIFLEFYNYLERE